MRERSIEWPTFAMLGVCYIGWGIGVFWVADWSVPLAVLFVGWMSAQHSSLSHEALHGHPTRVAWLNAALVFPALSLFVPYLRFRDTHLAHHRDSLLTDPYDDPESNYFDPVVWEQFGKFTQALLRFNNTLLGRISIGPLIGQILWMASEWRLIREGDMRVRLGWMLHIPAVGIVISAVWASPMSVGAYLVAAYLSLALIRIRTFLEHRSHEKMRARTVVIEDRGPLSLLFLNNNFHAVHHMHPQVAWYKLPWIYAQNKDRYLALNDGYRYRNYREIFRAYFLRSKDPVPHPLMWQDPD